MFKIMTDLKEAQTKVAVAYDAAADLFDHPVNTFWDRFGLNNVEFRVGDLLDAPWVFWMFELFFIKHLSPYA